MRNSIIRFVLAFIALCGHYFLAAQQTVPFKVKELGTPLINAYLPTDFGAHEQTYRIAQDSAGLLYFANVSGILVYDGENWDVDTRVSDDAFKSVAIDRSGRIYGASRSTYGYFCADSKGVFNFNSLIPKTPVEFKDRGSLTSTDYFEEHIIMRSASALLDYDIANDTIQLIEAAGRFGITDIVDGTYYAIDYANGLNKLVNGALEPVPGTADLKSLGVRKIIRHSTGKLLIITKEKGLFLYDFKQLIPWETEVTAHLNKHFGFAALNLFDQYFALGTETGGVVIIDQAGRLIQKLDASMGISNGLVQDLFLDKDRNLWIAQHGLISQVILNSPFTVLDERHGVNGYVLYFMKHEGFTYVATATGVAFHKDDEPWQRLDDEKPFRPLSDETSRAWMFARSNEDFFAMGNMGLWQIEGDEYRELYRGERLWAVTVFEEEEQMVIGSVEDYLHLFEKREGRWQYSGKIKGFMHAMDFLEQTEDGDLWMTDSGTGVFKIRLNEAKTEAIEIKKYGKAQGLPQDERNRVFRHKGGLLFATAEGIYRYNKGTDRFEPDEKFNQQVGEDYVFRFIEMANGTIYASLNPRGKALLKPEGEGWSFSQFPFNRIDSHNSEYVSDMGTNDIWIAGSGIRHYDHEVQQMPAHEFKAHIHGVSLSSTDSLLYGGVGPAPETVLSVQQNALKFSFSANFYDDTESISYRSFLEGTETDWSGWNDERFRNYTNLPHGSYTFKLQARNVYGELSEVAEFPFVIITPWYLTLWAYGLYVVLLLILVWFIVKLNSRRLEGEKLALEQLVNERTHEIRKKKEEAEAQRELIQRQADRLKELDQVKSRFFANISHELRTPLTLINAPLERLMDGDGITDPETRKTLETVKRNGVSLLSLVEEILDLAKLDAGKLELVQNPVRISECLRDLCTEFDLGFKEKGVSFEHDIQVDRNAAILMDENKCGKIMKNLISNALKFTPAGGEVGVKMSHDSESNMLCLEVSDTGEGIHPNDLPHIFDRYYQSEQPGKKAHGGTGIGLALALELARLQGGDLKVKSELGQGSCFALTIPFKEVALSAVEELTQVDNESLKVALTETIDRYNEKFDLTKPVMLVTEDHPEMRAFIASTLSPYFKVLEVANGEEALAVLSEHAVDVMVSDVMMPGMDGFELLSAVRKNEDFHDLSVVMLTARADEEDKLYALTLGIDDYITKPFSSAEFLARIKNILENRIKVIRELRRLRNSDEPEAPKELMELHGLSERELEVMQLLAKRFTNSEMAETLHISTNTVKYHIKNLYLKLDISSRAEAAKKAEELLSNTTV